MPRSRSRGRHCEVHQDEQAAMFIAAQVGDIQRLRRAIASGASPDLVALDSCICGLAEHDCVCLGYSPLHCAAQCGSTRAALALLNAQADHSIRSGRIMFSLKCNADESFAVDGITPLHVAAACGHTGVVELLLQHFADPHCGAVEPRRTALGFAVQAGQEDVAELLREAAADRMAQRLKTQGPEDLIPQPELSKPTDNKDILSDERLSKMLMRVRQKEKEGAGS